MRKIRATFWRRVIFLSGIIFLTACTNQHGKFTQDALNEAEKQREPAKISAELEKARQRFAAGELAESRRHLDAALTLDARNAEALLLRTQVMLESDVSESTMKNAVKDGLNVAPNEARFHYYYALFYDRRGDASAALAEYQTAANLDNDAVQYKIAAAEMLMELSRFNEAEKYLQAARKRHPNAAGVPQELGALAQMRGDFPEAARYYREATLLAPDMPALQSDLATAYYRSGDYVKAAAIIEKIPVADAEIQRIQAASYLHTNRPVLARQVLKTLLRNPENGTYETWAKLADAALMLDDFGGLKSAAEKMISLAPKNENGYLALARAYEMRGDHQQALTTLNRCPEANRSILFTSYQANLTRG